MRALTFRDHAFLGRGAGCGPPPLAANLQLWFKSDAGVLYTGGTPADGGYVDQWENQGVGTTDALNAVSDATRPTYHTGILNGYPALRFGGNNDYLQLANNADVDLTGNVSVFCVFKPASVADYNMILTKGVNSSQMQYEFRIDAAGLNYCSYSANGAFRTSFSAPGAGSWWRLGGFNKSSGGSESVATVNDNGLSIVGSALTIASKVAVAYIGRRYDSTPGSLYLNGDLVELGVYNAYLDAANRALLDDYLTCRYAL